MKTILTILLSAAAVALAGCAGPLPAGRGGPDPADPAAPAADGRYTPVTAGTADYRPVVPGSWREQNERVAPRRTP